MATFCPCFSFSQNGLLPHFFVRQTLHERFATRAAARQTAAQFSRANTSGQNGHGISTRRPARSKG
jgi:hypothetical protein